MKDNYAIRTRRTGELVATFDNPIAAEMEIRKKNNPDDFEVAERQVENVYTRYPDGKVYITGTEEHWIRYDG